MARNQRMAGMLRGITGMSQRQFAQKVGLHSRHITAIEGGEVEPTPQDLRQIAQGAGMTVADADELLRHAEALVSYRERQDQGSEEVLPALMERLKSQLSATCLRLLALPDPRPRFAESRSVEELMALLRTCAPGLRVALVQVAEEYQSQELYERVREEAAREEERGAEEAADWAHLAEEIAAQLQKPKGATEFPPGKGGGD